MISYVSSLVITATLTHTDAASHARTVTTADAIVAPNSQAPIPAGQVTRTSDDWESPDSADSSLHFSVPVKHVRQHSQAKRYVTLVLEYHAVRSRCRASTALNFSTCTDELTQSVSSEENVKFYHWELY